VLSPVFMSIEEYLGRNTAEYYRVLSEVGGGSWQPERDAQFWVRFTLTAHLRQARTMLVRVQESERLWVELDAITEAAGLPSRTVMALFDAALSLRVRNATYRANFESLEDEISDQTASRDLRQLVDADLLVPHREKRARYYTASERVLAVRRKITERRDARDDSDPFAIAQPRLF
jgi:Fic family protein